METISKIQELYSKIPEEKMREMKTVRKAILESLQPGFVELVDVKSLIISYVVPVEKIPISKNNINDQRQPFTIVQLRVGLNEFSLLLLIIQYDESKEKERYLKKILKDEGIKFDLQVTMHFKKAETIPLKQICELIAHISVDEAVGIYKKYYKIPE